MQGQKEGKKKSSKDENGERWDGRKLGGKEREREEIWRS